MTMLSTVAASPVAAPETTRDLRRALVDLRRELAGRALRLSRCPMVADDLVQETMERALRFEDQYRPGTNYRAWLHQILFSVFVTMCRRGKRERNALGVLGTDPCAWTLPEAPVVERRLSPAVERALAALPPAFRAVVQLVDLDELPYKEAADQLGVPIGTVMSRLHRGRRLLASALREPGEAAPALAA